MKILFIHQNFPGQFHHVAPAMVRRGHTVLAMKLGDGEQKYYKGVRIYSYSVDRSTSKDIHPWVRDFETKVIRAEGCLRAALMLKNEGFTPDLVMAHMGWGESMFIKQVWPNAKIGIYCEFFYSPSATDVGFDPEFSEINPDFDACRVKLKNLNNFMHFEFADFGVSPTAWQASTFPKSFQKKMHVIHDGIDTEKVRPDSKATIKIKKKNGRYLGISRNDQVITFINRNLEPYRGYHVFMRALPDLLKKYPNLCVLIIGGNGVSYGAEPEVEKYGKKSWRDIFAAEVRPKILESQWARVHFMGQVSYPTYLKVLQLSKAHVYLTYPFVLSWSLLEAMSAACPIVASDTGPLKGIIEDDYNGLLVDFFSITELVKKVGSLLENPIKASKLGDFARKDCIKKFDLKLTCLPAHLKLLEAYGSGQKI